MTYDQILEGTKWSVTLSLLGLALTTGGAVSGFVILTQDPQNHAVIGLSMFAAVFGLVSVPLSLVGLMKTLRLRARVRQAMAEPINT